MSGQNDKPRLQYRFDLFVAMAWTGFADWLAPIGIARIAGSCRLSHPISITINISNGIYKPFPHTNDINHEKKMTKYIGTIKINLFAIFPSRNHQNASFYH